MTPLTPNLPRVTRPHPRDACARGGARLLAALCVFTAVGAASCGYTEQEWAYQLDKNARLRAQRDASERRAARAEREAADAKQRASDLLAELRGAEGGEPDGAPARPSDSDAAERAAVLRRKLASLEAQGVSVDSRDDQVVVELTTTALFPERSFKLTAEGKALVAEVASAMRSEPSLAEAPAEISCFAADPASRDSWDAALTRAREILLHATSEGGMPVSGWVAAARAYEPAARGDAAAPGSGEVDVEPARPKKKGKKGQARPKKPLIGPFCELLVQPTAVRPGPGVGQPPG